MQRSVGFLPGAASLHNELNKKVLVSLRDGKTIIGYLRSYDPFANLVLDTVIERIIVPPNLYGDIKRDGIYVVRGENVSLLGIVNKDLDEDVGRTSNGMRMKKVSADEILVLQRAWIDHEKEQALLKKKIMLEQGFSDLLEF